MTIKVTLLLSGVIAIALASQAPAKEGVVAYLRNPAVLKAPAGKAVALVWTLRAGKQPFGASAIYVRLRGRTGATTSANATELGPGRYRARVVIPRSGARSIVIGLQGWVSDARGTRRADMFFPIENDPLRR